MWHVATSRRCSRRYALCSLNPNSCSLPPVLTTYYPYCHHGGTPVHTAPICLPCSRADHGRVQGNRAYRNLKRGLLVPPELVPAQILVRLLFKRVPPLLCQDKSGKPSDSRQRQVPNTSCAVACPTSRKVSSTKRPSHLYKAYCVAA